MALLEPSTPYLPGTLASTSPAVAKMLRRWNYKDGSGLGARGQGPVAPIQPAVQRHKAGIGYRKKPYDNGLPDDTTTPPVVQDEWHRRCQDLSRALELEEECCDKAIALLRDMTAEGDDDAETADALAALVESRKVFKGQQQRAPGTWKATLPSSNARYVVERVVKPRMAVDVQEWMPSWDPDCHHWLRPWIPLVGHLPDSLYDAVKSKIVARAGECDYHGVVSPWKEYMDPAQWGRFARRHVLPMLARLLRGLRITPPKQTDPSFGIVMLWAPLVPAQDMVSLLEEELFFDRYEDALRHWLQSAAKPSSSEAVAWCAGWKRLFTPELLAQERVVARLDAVVALVDSEAHVDVGPQQPLQPLLVDCMHRLQFVV